MNEERPPAPASQLRKPVDFDHLFPGRFLKAGQLGTGKPTVTIKSVDLDRLPSDKGGEETKGVITFAEMQYQLVLNKTNGLCLRAMFGREVARWIGRKITLYAGTWNREPAVRIWGSPELTEEKSVTIKLPRRTPFQHILHPVAARDATRRPDVERHPTEGQPAPASSSTGKDPDGGERPPFGG
jgi:hypothetical protein